MLSRKQFKQFADDNYNRIPLVREMLADCETPLSTFMKLAEQPFGYLLESVQGGEKWGRYSIIGLPCRRRLEVRDKVFREFDGDAVVREITCDDPLQEIRAFHSQHRVPDMSYNADMPRFGGGLVGFFGYDTVRYVEPHLGANATPDPIGAPDILLMVSEEVVVFDNLSGRLFVIVHADGAADDGYETASARLNEILAQLKKPAPQLKPAASAPPPSECNFSFPRDDYLAAVEKCRNYIFDGDVFQVVLSQRMSLPYSGAPLDLYRALRTLNPSPYMYYLNLGDYHIAGASPEILARLEADEITLRPIAGTRKRGESPAQDEALAAELLADPKELAEHLMLIDLGRNDVGRVAKIGTVEVTDKMSIEKYSHVMHIVSNVRGKIKDGLDAIDVLKAAFPAGTLSGAPKVRAMEIIEDLEPDKRGIYSGAIGYLGWNGNMDAAIAIRTALIKHGTVYIQSGGGIVADSSPEGEWEEAMNKGRAVLKAADMARAGLDLPLDQCDGDDDDENV